MRTHPTVPTLPADNFNTLSVTVCIKEPTETNSEVGKVIPVCRTRQIIAAWNRRGAFFTDHFGGVGNKPDVDIMEFGKHSYIGKHVPDLLRLTLILVGERDIRKGVND